MKYTPGMLIGGTVVHDCNPDRSIGYYLGVLACLAPFMKTDLNITLRGVTHDNVSYSVCLLCVLVEPDQYCIYYIYINVIY